MFLFFNLLTQFPVDEDSFLIVLLDLILDDPTQRSEEPCTHQTHRALSVVVDDPLGILVALGSRGLQQCHSSLHIFFNVLPKEQHFAEQILGVLVVILDGFLQPLDRFLCPMVAELSE